MVRVSLISSGGKPGKPIFTQGRAVFSLCRCQTPAPHWIENLASMGPGILSSIGFGVWRKRSGVFPDSNIIGGALKGRRRRRAEKRSPKTRNYTATCSHLVLQCSGALRANLRGERRKRTLRKHPFWTTVFPHDAFSAPLAHSELCWIHFSLRRRYCGHN